MAKGRVQMDNLRRNNLYPWQFSSGYSQFQLSCYPQKKYRKPTEKTIHVRKIFGEIIT